ncbi:MAG: type I restriction-modification system subunit M N-terminal domain-containing protein [Dermatophilaceae bacterium]
MSEARRLVDKLWSYCNVLRDDGVGTIEYTEQLTYLLFLKMAHEREIRALNPERIVPENCSWQRLLDADGDDLEVTYRHILEDLGKQPGTLGVIFRKAQNRIQDPAKLKRLIVDLIDKENWSATGTDIKGDVYEELLSKDAEKLTPTQREHLRDTFVHGTELVDGTARLAAMNLLLHGISTPNG